MGSNIYKPLWTCERLEKAFWPTCKIVTDNPKYPSSQWSVERPNEDVESKLRTQLIDDTKYWAIRCYFDHLTALFGTEPKTLI